MSKRFRIFNKYFETKNLEIVQPIQNYTMVVNYEKFK